MSKKFKIPELRMPTPEEHREISLTWLKRIKPTLIDQWPKDLAALSMPTQLIPFPKELIDEFFALHDGNPPGSVMAEIARQIDNLIGWDHKFVRLNSRSPKDYPWPFAAPATCSGKEAILILAGSMRVVDDLNEFRWIPNDAQAYICLRDFLPWIKPAYEFRCFVKKRDLIAVTHYDYTEPTPQQIIDNADEIRQRIDTWFQTCLEPVLHMDTVVFDVAMRPNRELMLIEINPYGLSDPCWFRSYDKVETAQTDIEVGLPNHPQGNHQ